MQISSRIRRTCGVLVAALIAAHGLVARAEAQASDPPAVMIVVDGSGSMWAAFDATRHGKSVVVREALRGALGNVNPRARVGLASFGHRRPSDCSDVEIIRDPEPFDAERIMSPLMQLNPRGRGPLTLALREAAKVLHGSGPRRMLLIHDDADNCQADLCEAAAELRSENIEVHVVGIGTKPADVAKMACLPQTTGGRHFNAQNAAEAGTYVAEALRLASFEASSPGRRPAPPRQPQAAPLAPPPPVPASGPPALHLRALLAPNAGALDTPLRWTVTDAAKPGLPLFSGLAATPVVPVAGGRYAVEVSTGAVSARQVVAAGDRPMAVTLVLGAGRIRARVIAQRSGVPVDGAIVSISAAPDGDGRAAAPAAPVAVFKGGEATALLPAGTYTVRAEAGLLRAEKSVTLAAGQDVPVDLTLGAARLRLTTAEREGMQPFQTPLFLIFEDDPDAASGRREVARSAANPAEFVLPPGSYQAVARQGSVEARERIAVAAGDVVSRTLTAPAGRLSLASRAAVGLAGRGVSYTIRRIDGGAQEVVTTSQPSPTLFLPAGRYRVESRYGLANVAAVQEIDVRAGQTHDVTFEHEAGLLKLRFAIGGQPAEAFWQVLDRSGQQVWSSAQAEPVAILQAGSYRVVAEARDKRHERPVEVRGGETRTVDISAE